MTTTVYDTVNRKIAADSRWSAKLSLSDGIEYLVYVDDSGFHKIADRKNAVLMLAGNGGLIAKWKEWWYTSLDGSLLPDTDINGVNVISLMIIDKINNKVLFTAGQNKPLYCKETNALLSLFTGSGDIHAASCWNVNRCVQRAIESASLLDYYTSNQVKYVDFVSNTTNASEEDYDYSNIVNAILERGYIMNLAESTAANDAGVPLNTHQIYDEVQQIFVSGRVVASAPVPGLSEFIWTDANKKDLAVAINLVKNLENL